VCCIKRGKDDELDYLKAESDNNDNDTLFDKMEQEIGLSNRNGPLCGGQVTDEQMRFFPQFSYS